MKIQRRISIALLSLSAAFPLAVISGETHAQASVHTVAAPRIQGFDVEQVKTAVAGTELDFTLYGTPGSVVTVVIEGAAGKFQLDEVEAGVYEGTYTIKNRDRITAGAVVTANLRQGNQVATTVLDESLLTGAQPRFERASRNGQANMAPIIHRFNVEPADRLTAGNELSFKLTGTTGGKASIVIAGVKGKFLLEETTKGVYEGVYTIKQKDRIASDAAVTATLHLGNKDTSALLGTALVASSTNVRRSARACANCGTVEAINVVDVKGDGSYVGMIAGGLAGALLGSQVGQGRGTTVAEIAAAAGGAYAGNEAEKYMKRSKHYEVMVRLQGGGAQTISYTAQPSFSVGDKVRVESGALVVDG